MSQGKTSGLLLALLAGFAGAGLWEYVSETVSAQSSVSKVVQTERLDIVNRAGKTVAHFGVVENGAMLTIGDDERRVSITDTALSITKGRNESAYLSSKTSGPIVLSLISGERGAYLWGDANLTLTGNDNGSAKLSVAPDGEPSLLLKSGPSDQRIALLKATSLALLDQAANMNIVAGIRPNVAAVTVSDGGRARAIVKVSEHKAAFELRDPHGKTVWTETE